MTLNNTSSLVKKIEFGQETVLGNGLTISFPEKKNMKNYQVEHVLIFGHPFNEDLEQFKSVYIKLEVIDDFHDHSLQTLARHRKKITALRDSEWRELLLTFSDKS